MNLSGRKWKGTYYIFFIAFRASSKELMAKAHDTHPHFLSFSLVVYGIVGLRLESFEPLYYMVRFFCLMHSLPSNIGAERNKKM